MRSSEMEKYRFVLYRGGTSKALFFMENELPSEPRKRDRLLLEIYGSPDPRQINDLGGSDSTTSKVALIGPPSVEGADVDYTFGQVSLEVASIDWTTNCGNISSAVGPFVIDEGMIRAQEPMCRVRIHNTNTRKILTAHVPIKDGHAAVEGDYVCPGVPGTGAMISMDFSQTAGSATGHLLPTGRPIDVLDVDDLGPVEVSLVDAGNLYVFMRAADVGATGVEDRLEINADRSLLDRLERIRASAAVLLGFASSDDKATEQSPLRPAPIFVSEPKDYVNYINGETIARRQVSLLGRVVWNQMGVETYTGTGSVCTLAATLISGTVVNQLADPEAVKSGVVRIGHPTGVMELEGEVSTRDGEPHLERAIFKRTARRLAEGYVYARIAHH